MSKKENLYEQFRVNHFSQIIGHTKIINYLKGAIKYDIYNNFLIFYGDYGIGKTSIARIYSQSLNCAKKNILKAEELPCGECKNCLNPKYCFYEINASNFSSLDDIRSLVSTIKIGQLYGKYKVYILDEFHSLGIKGFSLLLKTVEELPENVFFIGIANNIKNLPLPLLSRALKFKFSFLDKKYLEESLLLIESTAIKLKLSTKDIIKNKINKLFSFYKNIENFNNRDLINKFIYLLSAKDSQIVEDLKKDISLITLFEKIINPQAINVTNNIKYFEKILEIYTLDFISEFIANNLIRINIECPSAYHFELAKAFICENYDKDINSFKLFIILAYNTNY